MDAIKAQLLRIQQQLSGLSASQKMLTASLVAIMVMTMIWWGRYAGTAEMVPVLDQSFSASDIGQIKAALDARGFNTTIVGDKVMVPADRKMEAVAALAYADAIPSNASAAWDEMIKQMTAWDSRAKTEMVQNHMRERMISDVIQGFFPGVARANVIINPVNQIRIGESLQASASVQITTRGRDQDIKKLVEAAASTVASAVPGLNRSRVSVVIDGIPRHVASADQSFGGGGDIYDTMQAQERWAQEKILRMLPYPGTLVAVTVDLDTITSEKTNVTYQKGVSAEKRIESKTEETSQPLQQSAEPGAVSNTSLSLNATAAAPTATTSSETNNTDLENFPSRAEEHLVKPAGKPSVVSAAVRLPRSYFVSEYKVNNPSAKEPDDAALQPLVNAELPAIKAVVQNTVAMKSEDGITVDMYYDGAAPMGDSIASANPGGTSTASSMAAVVGGHGKEIAIGALALISLFMISTIVKKGAPTPVIAPRVEPKETPRIGAIEDIAGVVGGESTATLDGMELDEDAIRAQQMVEQVSTMVKEDPDAAAALVKRWLNRS